MTDRPSTASQINTAFLASLNESRALNAPLIAALSTVFDSMEKSRPDEWAMEWLGEVWSTLPLEVRAAAGDTDAANELADVRRTQPTAPTAPSAPADRAAILRDRIAAALYERERPTRDPAWADAYAMDREVFEPMADAVLAVLPEHADRAAVLREAANGLAALGPLDSLVSAPAAWTEAIETVRRMADQIAEDELRRMADEAQQPETQADDKPAVCGGFQWIGQSFATCDRCGQPAWDHDGEEVAVDGAGPFDTRRTVRPWAPGQADRIRAKWGTPAATEQQPKEA